MAYKAWVMVGVAMSALTCGGAVQAAETASTSSSSVEEIIVTAQKREQSLQSVPGSISAFGAAQLKVRGIESVQDLASQTPGLDYGQHNGASFVTLRGVGLAVDTGVAEPNVAVHVDGVFLPRTTMATLDYTDLERVEVLRGPQGTLYGRNATGGAINFISQAPADHFGGLASVSYSNFDTVNVEGVVTGPIANNIQGRLSAGYDRRGTGYTDDTFTGSTIDKNERFNVRGALAFEFSPTVRLDLSAQYQTETFETYQQLIYPAGPLGAILFPPLATAISPTQPWKIGDNYTPESKRSTLLGRAGLTWQVTPDITLKSITGYIDHRFTNRIDGDGTSADYIAIRHREQPSRSISQEFDLSGRFWNRGTWLLGLYGFHEDFSSSIPVVLPSGLPIESLPPETTLLSQIGEKTTSYAAFTDATFSLTNRLRVYGGVRYSHDKKDEIQTAGAVIPGVPEAYTLSCDGQKSKLDYNSTSPRIGLEYDVVPHVMAYAQYSRGFKSGGLNSTTCGNTYKPETLESTEIGLKSQFLAGRATLNASVFNYRYHDLQIFKIVLVNAEIENADAHYRGGDIEGRFKLNDNWRLDGSATILDAKFAGLMDIDPAEPTLGLQDLNGKEVPRAPRYLANIGVQGDFQVELGPFNALLLRADGRFSAHYYFQDFNTPSYEQGAYAMGDLTARLSSKDDGIAIRAFVHNVGDVAVKGHVFYNSIQDAYLGNYLPPRTYGVQISRRF